MAVIKAVNSKASIKQAINYVTKDEKTEEKLISGYNCLATTADEFMQEMQATKEAWNKTGGRTYKHFGQSFAPGENVTPELAHKIAKELVEQVPWLQKYEVLIATHKDRKHTHTHFIVNSVSFEDGYKLQQSNADLQLMKDKSDELCRQYGLTITEKGKTWDGQDLEETTAWDKDKYQWLKQAEEGKVKSYVQDTAMAVMDCLETATSREDFIRQMKERGYETDWQDNHKHVTFTDIARKEAGEKQCKVRNSNLAKTYHIEVGKEDMLNVFEINARTAETERAAEDQLKKLNNNSGTDDSDQGPAGRDNPVEVPDRADEGADKTAEILRNIEIAERSRASAEASRRDKQAKRKDRDTERERLDREAKQRAAERKWRSTTKGHSR